jgi:hypothetical protein
VKFEQPVVRSDLGKGVQKDEMFVRKLRGGFGIGGNVKAIIGDRYGGRKEWLDDFVLRGVGARKTFPDDDAIMRDPGVVLSARVDKAAIGFCPSTNRAR